MKLIGEHYDSNGIRVRFYGDGEKVTVERHQDSQSAIDFVAAVNAEGAPTIDGLGKPVAEVPVAAAMQFCEARGIPWEKFLYGNEYDEEFKRFAAEYSKLAYVNAKSVHTVQ